MKLALLTTAPDQITAETWCNLLEYQGVPVVVRAGDTSAFLGVSVYPCRILVAENFIDHAREILGFALDPEQEQMLS